MNFTSNAKDANSSKLFISNNGYIGVGSINPQYRFHIVDGDVAVDNGRLTIGSYLNDLDFDWGITSSKPIVVSNNAYPSVQVTGGDNDTFHTSIQLAVAMGDYYFSNNSKKGDAVIKAISAGNFIMTNEGGGDIKFASKQNFNATAKIQMTINNVGNVGIGTETPDAKFAVNGLIHTKEVRVDLIGWPDYVFKSTFQLTPLPELEKQIKTLGHLPEVPDAKTVESSGLIVGEMNKIFMKKIEELTLYVIELNKKIEQLTKK